MLYTLRIHPSQSWRYEAQTQLAKSLAIRKRLCDDFDDVLSTFRARP